MTSTRINITVLLLLLICLSLKAQSGNWVQAEGQCVIANITPEEARLRAIERARSEAIKRAIGINVSEEIFRVVREDNSQNAESVYDYFSKLNTSTSYGRIVDERIILDTSIIQGDLLISKVVISADVVKEEGNNDPSFNAEIIMAKDVYFDRSNSENDKLEFQLWATKECYFYLFNILSNDSVQVLLPNFYIDNNFYSPNRKTQSYEKQLKNLSFYVGVPRHKERVIEGLYLVAIKDKIDFLGSSISTTHDGFIPTYQAAIKDIQNWLVKIPRDKRTDTFHAFEIRKLE